MMTQRPNKTLFFFAIETLSTVQFQDVLNNGYKSKSIKQMNVSHTTAKNCFFLHF